VRDCLALVPVPVISLILALFLELFDVIAEGIAIVLGPVGTIAIVLFNIVANLVRNFPHLIYRFVGVLAPVRVVSTGICGSSREEESEIDGLHDEYFWRGAFLLTLEKVMLE